MNTFARAFLVLLLALLAGPLNSEILGTQRGAYSVALAFNDNQEACSIPSSEFVSLIQSINHAEENFLLGTDELVPRMWWGATLGLNNSLDEPFDREALELTILGLRESQRIIPELSLFLRIEEVRRERNARDFFLLVSDLCEKGLITKAETHTDSAIRRAHSSLGDTYSTYLTPTEAESFWNEEVSQIQEPKKETGGACIHLSTWHKHIPP